MLCSWVFNFVDDTDKHTHTNILLFTVVASCRSTNDTHIMCDTCIDNSIFVNECKPNAENIDMHLESKSQLPIQIHYFYISFVCQTFQLCSVYSIQLFNLYDRLGIKERMCFFSTEKVDGDYSRVVYLLIHIVYVTFFQINI